MNNKVKVLIFLSVSLFIIGVIVYSLLNRTVKPVVTATNPTDGAINILETSPIDITFDSTITSQIKSGITINIEPQINFDSTWLLNTYKLIPKTNLLNNQNYTVDVFYNKSKIYTFGFKTEVFNQNDVQKFGPRQSQDDLISGQDLTKIVNLYPWYTSLPIKTQNYVVYYDFQKQKFAITFLSKISADEQTTLTKDALTNIKAIGVKDPIQYYVTNPAASTPSPAP